jgi:uncharacterized protein (TIGR02444 family)
MRRQLSARDRHCPLLISGGLLQIKTPVTNSASRLHSETPFWRFSLGFYRQPGVADACITLQEESGIDVNLLLFLLWHATHGHALSAGEVKGLERRIGPWREMTVVPLRKMRRVLKSPGELVEPGAAEVFRTKVKALELEAERLQQEAMYAPVGASLLGRKVASAQDAAQANIATLEASCGRGTFSREATQTLLATFGHVTHKPEE